MKKSLIICALLVSSVCLSAQPQTNDWASTNRYSRANASLSGAPSVVFMGNSITEGWWNQDSLFFKNHNFAGRGISGQVSAQMLVRFRNDVIDLKPRAVVILAGTNDIAQNNGYISLENVLNNIISMTELALANGIDVVLCSVMPASEFRWRKEIKDPAQSIKRLNEMIKEYAEKQKITYVDYHSALSDENGGLPTKYSADGVHPNIEGYKIMETVVMPALKKYVKK